MLKYADRIGCSALTDLVKYICPKGLDHSITLYIDISLIINGSFIVARAFYAHVLCPRLDKMCMKVYANYRYKDKSAQTLSIRVTKDRSLISRRQPYCAKPILIAHAHRLVCTYVICVCHMTGFTTTRLIMVGAGINVF